MEFKRKKIELNKPNFFAGIIILFFISAVHSSEVEIQPLKIKSYLDFGHLVSGYNTYGDDGDKKIGMLPLNRGNVSFLQSVTMGDKFDVSVGVTGLIWWPYSTDLTQPKERVMRVKPMVPLARAKWSFGKKEELHGYVQLGTFPYKYNFDAKNLGEYLYRSGTYPGFLWTTEGWLYMNRAGQYAHGVQARFTHLNGLLTHNISLFMEMVFFPVGDFSPGYDFSFKLPFFEVGGGVVLNHFIPIRPSMLSQSDRSNIYVLAPAYTDTLNPLNSHGTYYGPKDGSPTSDDTRMIELDQWTHKGVKLMGRLTFNLNSLLPEESRSKDDFKIFTEVAVLGWKDYPFYYQDRKDRMPIMFGLNIPTFKLLDILSFQVEHYSSPFNDITTFYENSLPIWSRREPDINTADSVFEGNLDGWMENIKIKKDDWKWSLYAKRKVNKIFTTYIQVASDHFRLMSQDFKPSQVPLTTNPKEWYYLFRLEFNIQ